MTRVYERSVVVAAAMAWASLPACAQDFFDDFQSDALNPAFTILNADSQRMALTQGEYLLLVTHPQTKNVVAYLAPLPSDFEVTVRLAQPPANDGQFFRIRIGDRTDNVQVGMEVNSIGNMGLWTGKTLNDESVPSQMSWHESLTAKPIQLRFRKLGVEYQGEFSTDGLRWTSLGSQVLIDGGEGIYLEAGAYNENTPESPVKIDSFTIRGL